MLGINSNRHTYPCISCLDAIHIALPGINEGNRIVLAKITEEEELLLADNETITLKNNVDEFIVDPKYCFGFGKQDLSPNSEFINEIHDKHCFDNFEINIYLLSDYDYETHTVCSDYPGGRVYESIDCRTYLPFLYACIGKPERTVIFKENISYKKKLNKSKSNKISMKPVSKTKKLSKPEIKLTDTVQEKIDRRQTKISKLNFTINYDKP